MIRYDFLSENLIISLNFSLIKKTSFVFNFLSTNDIIEEDLIKEEKSILIKEKESILVEKESILIGKEEGSFVNDDDDDTFIDKEGTFINDDKSTLIKEKGE